MPWLYRVKTEKSGRGRGEENTEIEVYRERGR
jgi:hypothetical protein